MIRCEEIFVDRLNELLTETKTTKAKQKNIERRTAARRANGNANHEKPRKNNGKDRCLLQRQRLRICRQ